ncbi:MAG: DUF5985 family protein [Thermoanaerobaculia bacterium]
MGRLNDIMGGGVVVSYLIVALFFLRFWTGSRDRLFAFFAAAFAILGLQRLAVLLLSGFGEHQALLYSMRLVAFLLIIAAVADKNRRPRAT